MNPDRVAVPAVPCQDLRKMSVYFEIGFKLIGTILGIRRRIMEQRPKCRIRKACIILLIILLMDHHRNIIERSIVNGVNCLVPFRCRATRHAGPKNFGKLVGAITQITIHGAGQSTGRWNDLCIFPFIINCNRKPI